MPDAAPQRVSVGGLELSYVEQGSGDPVLLFHGFPDIATSFMPLTERLAGEGFRCISPWLRGYWPSAAGRYYDAGALVSDAVGLMDALELPRAYVIGHDWGADVAYGLSAARPDRVDAALVLAVPHSDALGPNRLASFEQLRRSFYMWLFQVPGLAEDVVRADDFAFLRRLWAEWSPGWQPPAAHLEHVVDCFRHDGVATAGLAYYRAVFDEELQDPDGAQTRRAAARTITVPTLLLLGERDGCIAPDMAVGAENAFTGPYETITLPDCGHFLQLEHPDTVAEHAVRWFRRWGSDTT